MRDESDKQARLETQYRSVAGKAEAFAEELGKQLLKCLEQAGIPLAFPIQRRVKKWESLAEKFSRVSLVVDSVLEVQDLVGLRVIILFRRDLPTIDELLRRTLRIERAYDTGDRLKPDQFGYSSCHYIAGLPDEWLKVPTFAGMGDLRAEIQVRTLAQHMWAEASQFLQYKREDSVPLSIRRALYRGSAILETLDLEFDRILAERDEYRGTLDVAAGVNVLDVDVLERTLDSLFPAQNKDNVEPFAELLLELRHFGVTTADGLRRLVKRHLNSVMRDELQQVREAQEDLKRGLEVFGTDADRTNQGVYFTFVGLARGLLGKEFGDDKLRAYWLDQLRKT